MGFGLPAAIGVQMAHPDATVACVTGESSIQMCIQELATCLQYELPIKIILLNNGYMGMVRQWQEFFYESRYSQSGMSVTPDFVKLAEAYGHVGMRIEKPEELEGAMQEAFSMKDRLVFMDVCGRSGGECLPDDCSGKRSPRDVPVTEERVGLMRHIISILMENESGALSRVCRSVHRAWLQHRVIDRGADTGSQPFPDDLGDPGQ